MVNISVNFLAADGIPFFEFLIFTESNFGKAW